MKGEKKQHNAPPVSRHRGTIGSPGVNIDRLGSLPAIDKRLEKATGFKGTAFTRTAVVRSAKKKAAETKKKAR